MIILDFGRRLDFFSEKLVKQAVLFVASAENYFSLFTYLNFFFILCHSLDPTRMLITLGASTAVQDNFHGNTALHWAIIARNSTAVSTLTTNGANLGIRNNAVSTFCITQYL